MPSLTPPAALIASTPIACPYRQSPRISESGAEVATCGLAGEVTGVRDPELLRVSRDLCELCIKRPPAPDPAHPNPLAASMVCVVCERVLEQGGTAECDPEKARSIIRWAAQHLDVAGGRAEMRAVGHARRDPCLYLGDQTGERPCLTCAGNVRQKVFTCHHELHTDTTILDCAECPDHEARLRAGPRAVETWAAGVTTAPRTTPTLGRTLGSLAAAGWSEVVVFAEPGTPLPPDLAAHRLVQRPVALGAWPNWLLGLQELILRYPWADAYLLCQDDVVFVRDLRAYLEHSLWPSSKTGVVSLHTAHHQEPAGRGFSPLPPDEVMAWGAQAYIFPNAAARAFLRSSMVVNHRARGINSGLCNIDTLVGQWCALAGFPYFVHSPSPTQHIGETSAIWEHGEIVGRRRATSFPGEEQNFCSLMGLAEPAPRPSPNSKDHDPWTSGGLTVCAPTIGRREALVPWSRWLLQAELPADTRLYILDNSGDAEFAEIITQAAREFAASDRFAHVHLHIRRHPPPIPSRHTPARHENVADAYNAALQSAPHTQDFVFLLDDDTIPPMDGLRSLYDGFVRMRQAGHRPGAISGCYESATNRGRLVATRSKIDWSNQIPVASVKSHDVIDVGTTGSGCLLIDGPLFWECFPVRGESITGICGPDSYLCAEIRRRGRSVWLHGGVRCDHLAC